MANVILRQQELNGKKITYHSKTEFKVQVGRYQKGSYESYYHVLGDLNQAVLLFNGINIGRGYKKRLVMGDKVLARCVSY